MSKEIEDRSSKDITEGDIVIFRTPNYKHYGYVRSRDGDSLILYAYLNETAYVTVRRDVGEVIYITSMAGDSLRDVGLFISVVTKLL